MQKEPDFEQIAKRIYHISQDYSKGSFDKEQWIYFIAKKLLDLYVQTVNTTEQKIIDMKLGANLWKKVAYIITTKIRDRIYNSFRYSWKDLNYSEHKQVEDIVYKELIYYLTDEDKC